MPGARGTLVLAAVLGLLVGSLLTAAIVRVPDRERGTSRPLRPVCPGCGGGVPARDNIPVLSWAWLRGRCRGCRMAIPAMYPLVEACAALVALVAVQAYGWSAQGGAAAAFGWLLLVVAVTDLRTQLIPLRYSLGGTLLGLAWSVCALGAEAALWRFGVASAAGALLWGLALAVGRAVGRAAMGGGDALLLCLLVLVVGLGLSGWTIRYAVLFTLAAFAARLAPRRWWGAATGGALLAAAALVHAPRLAQDLGMLAGILVLVPLRQREEIGAPLPFGPMLCLGAVAALLASPDTAALADSLPRPLARAAVYAPLFPDLLR